MYSMYSIIKRIVCFKWIQYHSKTSPKIFQFTKREEKFNFNKTKSNEKSQAENLIVLIFHHYSMLLLVSLSTCSSGRFSKQHRHKNTYTHNSKSSTIYSLNYYYTSFQYIIDKTSTQQPATTNKTFQSII